MRKSPGILQQDPTNRIVSQEIYGEIGKVRRELAKIKKDVGDTGKKKSPWAALKTKAVHAKGLVGNKEFNHLVDKVNELIRNLGSLEGFLK